MAEKVIIEFIGKDEVTKPAGKITGALGGLGKVAGGVALGGLTVAAGAAVGLGAAVTGLVKDAMPLEGVSAAFDGITEAAGSTATAVLDDFKTFSGNMITNAEAMASFNQAAQLVGDDFALRLPEAMGYLSKVSAATGEDVGFMLDSMVKGVGRLSPMILDNLGIQVNLTEANEAYAAQLGKSASELTKSEQQTAIMNQVMEKLAQNTAAMPEVTGTAAAAFGSFQATLTDTKDTIGLALLPVITPLLQAFSDLAAKILPVVATFITERLIPAISALVKWFKDEVAPRLAEAGKQMREELAPALKRIFEAFQNVAAALGLNTGNLDILGIAVDAIVVVLKGMTVFVKGLSVVINGLAYGFNNVANAIKWVIDKFNEMKEVAAQAAASIPSWLIPGSPTPFELGLRGIARELGSVNAAFGGVSVGGGGMMAAGGGGVASVTVNLTYSPAVSLGDRYEAESRLAPLIAGAVRQELEARGAI